MSIHRQIYFTLSMFILLAFSFNLNAQKRAADSIQRLIDREKNDTARVKLMYELTTHEKVSPERVQKIMDVLNYTRKLKFTWGEANVLARIGHYYMFSSTDYPLAAFWTNKALKLCLDNNFESGISQCYQQLGIISHEFEDETNALLYFHKARAINDKLDNYRSLRPNLSMLGVVHKKMHRPDSSLYYYRIAQKIAVEHKMSTSVLYVNMTNVFFDLNQLDSAAHYIHLTDSSYKAINNDYGEHWVNLLLGELELKKGRPDKALEYLAEPVDYGMRAKKTELLLEVLPPLVDAYKRSGNYAEAFKYLEQLNSLNDTVNGTKKATELIIVQKKFEEEQQAQILQLKQEKTEFEHREELSRRNRIIWGSGILLLTVSLFGLFILRGYRQKQKDNTKITQQKKIIEEKQKEILDSIHYAQRIQKALITSEKQIDKNLKKLTDNT